MEGSACFLLSFLANLVIETQSGFRQILFAKLSEFYSLPVQVMCAVFTISPSFSVILNLGRCDSACYLFCEVRKLLSLLLFGWF